MLFYKLLYLDSVDLLAPKSGDVGFDLPLYQDTIIEHNSRKTVGTGIAVSIPDGHVGLILGRSGHAFKRDLYVRHIGVIDSGYRGELFVRLENCSDEDIALKHGDRIAQLVILPCFVAQVISVSNLDDTLRGTNGFGSSDIESSFQTMMFGKLLGDTT